MELASCCPSSNWNCEVAAILLGCLCPPLKGLMYFVISVPTE